MPHPDWPDFDLWWLRVLEVSEEEDLSLDEADSEKYRDAWKRGASPFDAAMNGSHSAE